MKDTALKKFHSITFPSLYFSLFGPNTGNNRLRKTLYAMRENQIIRILLGFYKKKIHLLRLVLVEAH